MRKLWKKIKYLGIDTPDNSLQTRTHLLCNQLNFILMLVSIGVFLMLRITGIQSGSEMGIGSLRVLLLFLVTILNFVLAFYKRFSFVKFSLIFFPPFVFFVFPTVIGFVEAESFVYYPFLIIALSITPQLLLLPEKNKHLYWISIFYYLSLLLLINKLLRYFTPVEYQMISEIDRFIVFLKTAHLSAFFFINFAIYYLRKINQKYESDVLIINKSLEEKTEHLMEQNTLLEKNQIEIKDNYKKLEALQSEVNSQNIELKTTLENLKRAQFRIIQSEKLASLGTLTAGVAHEINNPLNFIAGGVAIFQSDLEDIFNDPKILEDNNVKEEIRLRIENSLKMIEEGVGKASNIVNALREYSSGGKSKKKPERLEPILDMSLSFLKSKISPKIKLIKHYDLNDEVPVFKDKIQQVFMNILDNALFALNKSDSERKEMLLHTYKENNKAVVLIENSGPEIPQKHVSKVFDPFFTTKDPNEGTGLGLSLCYNIVQEHEGQIDLINKPGQVAFIISLNL